MVVFGGSSACLVVLHDSITTAQQAGQHPFHAPSAPSLLLLPQVMDWMLEDGQVICVTGSIPQLGMWQPDQMLLLTGA